MMCAGEVYFGSLNGDLTRIGHLPERAFGWREPQPLIRHELLRSYPIYEADVFIVGDSFSESLVWQSQLVRDGFKPSTLHWNDVSVCTEDFAEAIRRSGFKGHYVVIEAVERTVQARMNSICKQGSKIGKSGAYTQNSPLTMQPEFSIANARLSATWVLETMVNSVRYTFRPSNYMAFGKTRMVATERGCDLFTNRLCDYGLYYADDFNKDTFNAVANILAINQNLMKLGMQAVWLVVPDKSTVYLGSGQFNSRPYVNAWQRLEQTGKLEVPALDQLFTEKSHQIKDFYAPNNTHLSPSGYTVLGEVVLSYIRRIKQADSMDIKL